MIGTIELNENEIGLPKVIGTIELNENYPVLPEVIGTIELNGDELELLPVKFAEASTSKEIFLPSALAQNPNESESFNSDNNDVGYISSVNQFDNSESLSLPLDGTQSKSTGKVMKSGRPYRYCIFCSSYKSRLSLHIKSVHKREPTAQALLMLSPKEVTKEIQKIKREGIYQENIQRLKDKKGVLKSESFEEN